MVLFDNYVMKVQRKMNYWSLYRIRGTKGVFVVVVVLVFGLFCCLLPRACKFLRGIALYNSYYYY